MRNNLITIASLLVYLCCGPLLLAGELGPAPDGSFTLAVIPDTQRYLGKGTKAQPESTDEVSNSVFTVICDWIVRHEDDQRIVFVSHVGDIVDKNVPEQWAIARDCMNRIHGRIAYGLSVGNHDMVGSGDSSLFQKYFPQSSFANFPWYGGAFEKPPSGSAISGNNANSYQFFSVGSLQFIVLHLECNAPDDVLQWANDLLTKHADRRAIITTHMDLGPLERPQTNAGYISDPKGRMKWKKCHGDRGNTPTQMWDKCFRKHKNVFLICSGDQSRTQAMHLMQKGDHGNVVHSCLSDYQSDGSVRLYRFLPGKNRIDVITYNTIHFELTRKTSLVANQSRHQFSFDYQMSR